MEVALVLLRGEVAGDTAAWRPPNLHTEFVFGVAFSPDGKRLATASRDRTVQVYALNLRELLNFAISAVVPARPD